MKKRLIVNCNSEVYFIIAPDVLRLLSSYYVGAAPNILVVDPEMIKQITVKEFDSFMDRTVR